jgi:hypothetical protein
MVIEARKADGTFNEAKLDQKSRALIISDAFHGKTHDGKTWTHTFEFSALGAGASVNIGVLCGAGTRIHCEAVVSADNAGAARVYKKPTYTLGSNVAGVNHDFDLATPSPATVVSAPTITDNGTLFESVHFASGVGQSGGGSANSRHEFIVSDTGMALVRFTAKNAGTNGSIMIVLYTEG